MQLADFQNLQKADLHRHFDGSVRCETLHRVIKEQHLSNAAVGAWEDLTLEKLRQLLTPEATCLEDYLRAFDVTLLGMQTDANLRLFAREFVEDAAHDNITHVELRYAPLLHTYGGMTAHAVHEAVDAACAAAAAEFSISVSIIVCAMKTQSPEQSDCLFELLQQENRLPLSYDQAGPESGFYAFSDFGSHFYRLKMLHIPFTLHAGEACGAENVVAAINSGASRVGHGVRSQESEAACTAAAAGKVLFEMCPTSNAQIHVVGIDQDLKNYPLHKYLLHGIPCTICTDNTTMSKCTTSGEYLKLYNALGLEPAEILLIADLGFKHGFYPAEERNRVRQRAFEHNVKILSKFDADIEGHYHELAGKFA